MKKNFIYWSIGIVTFVIVFINFRGNYSKLYEFGQGNIESIAMSLDNNSGDASIKLPNSRPKDFYVSVPLTKGEEKVAKFLINRLGGKIGKTLVKITIKGVIVSLDISDFEWKKMKTINCCITGFDYCYPYEKDIDKRDCKYTKKGIYNYPNLDMTDYPN